MRRRRLVLDNWDARIQIVGIALLALMTFGCDDTPSSPSECPETRSVRIVLENAAGQSVAQLAEGEFARIDLTPLDAQRNMQSPICHPPTARWDITPSTGVLSLLGDRSGFTLLVHADGPGVATITGCVDAVCAQFGVRVLSEPL